MGEEVGGNRNEAASLRNSMAGAGFQDCGSIFVEGSGLGVAKLGPGRKTAAVFCRWLQKCWLRII